MGQKGGPNIPVDNSVFVIDSKNPRTTLSSLLALFSNALGSNTSVSLSGSGYTSAFTFSTSTTNFNFSDLSVLKFTNNLTISSWIYPNSFGGGSSGRIYDKFKTTLPQSGYAMWIDNNIGTNAIAFGTGYVVSTSVARVNNVIVLNTWQHVSVTFSGTACTFYLNGASVGTVTGITAPTSGTNAAIIGNNTGNTNYFDGKIDNLRIYSRALKDSEISQIYNATKSRYGL